MSSKRAMKQAQKQAYAKHRSNITNSRFEIKKKFLILKIYPIVERIVITEKIPSEIHAAGT